jgi:uridine monophosphate synthetase
LKFGRFKIKSGALSPYYIDLARLLSSPKDLSALVEIAASAIKLITTSGKITKLASIALKGALILPIIAYNMDLPCVVVRKKEKAYGVTDRVAGAEVVRGDNILFFDDVISEGLSKLEGINLLEARGAHIKHLLVVVDREQGGRKKLEKLGYRVHALAKTSEMVKSLKNSGAISKEQADAVLRYISK